MANPKLPGLTAAEEASLYAKLRAYNEQRASYKEAGAYLMVLPHDAQTAYTLWVYTPLPGRQHIFYLRDLAADVQQALRIASTWCFYSERRLVVVDYNAKHMQSRGDDIVPSGKYRGHFLHEVLRVDPAYVGWIAFKFQPRIPKQERFVQIARIYHAAYLDLSRRQVAQARNAGRYLGRMGDRLEGLRLTVTGVRVEDNPYKTQVRDGVRRFGVRQVLRLKDAEGNHVTMYVEARTPSVASGTLPAMEHAYRPGEEVRIASARVARTYSTGGKAWTRLSHVRLEKE